MVLRGVAQSGSAWFGKDASEKQGRVMQGMVRFGRFWYGRDAMESVRHG